MSDSAATPKVVSIGPASASERVLWSGRPVLGQHPTSYQGRVLIEVWAGGETRVVTSDPLLIKSALVFMQTQTPVHNAEVTLPSAPITNHANEATFLGRVIVEAWSDGVVVGVIGSNDELILSHAIKRLQTLGAVA
jgi:hypothetical protein